MKKFLLVPIIFLAGGALFWRAQIRQAESAATLEVLKQTLARVSSEINGASNELMRLQLEVKARLNTAAAAPAHTGASSGLPPVPFGPPDGVADWSESGSFVWIEKGRIPALGLSAFRSVDSVAPELSGETARLITRLSRKFVEDHPGFGRLATLSPEEAATLHADYKRLLLEAAASLDGPGRRALESTIEYLDGLPIPGSMDQAPAQYRFSEDVASVLGLSPGERELVNRATAEMVQQYQGLERRYVMPSEEHSGEIVSPPAVKASFKVAAFPAEGGAIKAEWLAQLRSIVGEERTRYIVQLSESWIRSDLGDFGEADRTLTIRETPGSYGFTEKGSTGYSYSAGTGGPSPIPTGWRHLIVRPAAGGLPWLRQ